MEHFNSHTNHEYNWRVQGKKRRCHICKIVDIPGSSKVRSGHLRFFHGIAFHQRRPQVDWVGFSHGTYHGHAVNSGTEILWHLRFFPWTLQILKHFTFEINHLKCGGWAARRRDNRKRYWLHKKWHAYLSLTTYLSNIVVSTTQTLPQITGMYWPHKTAPYDKFSHRCHQWH